MFVADVLKFGNLYPMRQLHMLVSPPQFCNQFLHLNRCNAYDLFMQCKHSVYHSNTLNISYIALGINLPLMPKEKKKLREATFLPVIDYAVINCACVQPPYMEA